MVLVSIVKRVSATNWLANPWRLGNKIWYKRRVEGDSLNVKWMPRLQLKFKIEQQRPMATGYWGKSGEEWQRSSLQWRGEDRWQGDVSPPPAAETSSSCHEDGIGQLQLPQLLLTTRASRERRGHALLTTVNVSPASLMWIVYCTTLFVLALLCTSASEALCSYQSPGRGEQCSLSPLKRCHDLSGPYFGHILTHKLPHLEQVTSHFFSLFPARTSPDTVSTLLPGNL